MPEINDDQTIFKFDLRDDVVFHDGSKFSAEDVKYSYEYMLDPKNKSARRTLFSPIQEIVIESPSRIVFKMKYPYRPWFQYMTKFMGIFPKGSRDKIGDDGFKNNPVGVGTGPGSFVEWKQNDYVELKKHANYWRKGVPAWDRMVAKIVPEDAARVAYLMTNQAQIISAPPPREFERLKSAPGISTGSKVAVGGMWFMHNTKRAVRRRQFPQGGVVRDRPRRSRKEVFYGLMDPSAYRHRRRRRHNAEADKASDSIRQAKDYLAKSKYAPMRNSSSWSLRSLSDRFGDAAV